MSPKPVPNQQKKAPDPDNSGVDDVVVKYLNPNRAIDLKVKEILADQPRTYAIMLILPGEKHEQRYLRLLDYFVEQGLKGVYVTLNNATHELLQEMEGQNIKSEKIFFVDAVTKMIEGKELDGRQFCYLESPGDLVELGVEIDHAISNIGEEKGFVIIDSITTLLVYNKEVAVEKFLHTLSQKIKNAGFQGIFLAAESIKKETLDTIAQFCDDIKKL